MLPARSGGNFPLRLKHLLNRIKKTHRLSINCISVITIVICRPAGCICRVKCPLAARSCSRGHEGSLLSGGSTRLWQGAGAAVLPAREHVMSLPRDEGLKRLGPHQNHVSLGFPKPKAGLSRAIAACARSLRLGLQASGRAVLVLASRRHRKMKFLPIFTLCFLSAVSNLAGSEDR